MNSLFMRLAKDDLVKGIIVAVLGAVLITIQKSLTDCGFACIDWESVLTVGVTTGIAYLIKNFFTNSSGTLGRE